MRKIFFSLMFSAIAALGLTGAAQALTLSPPVLEISAKPGEQVKAVAKLFNEGSEALTIVPGALAFGVKNEEGQPDFFEDKTGLDLQHWITVPTTVTLAPGDTQSVVVNIDVPKSADPGGHYAAIFWGTTAPKVDVTGAGIQGRIAMLVLVNVEGKNVENTKIIEFHPVSSFLTHLPAEFIARFQNDGTVHAHPAGNLIIRNMFGRQSTVLPFNIQPATGNVLPKSIRRFDLSWSKQNLDAAASEWSKEWNNFAWGRYTAELDAAYGSVNTLIVARTSFWVFPWMVTLVGLIALLAIIYILRLLVMSYNRRIIAKYTQRGQR